MNIKALYTLFKRSRITKKIVIGAIYENSFTSEFLEELRSFCEENRINLIE